MAGDCAYVGHYDNEFLCLDLHNAKVLYEHCRNLDFPYMTAAAVTADGGYDKVLHCVSGTGKSLSNLQTRARIRKLTVVAAGKVVFASNSSRWFRWKGNRFLSHCVGQPVGPSPAVSRISDRMQMDGNV